MGTGRVREQEGEGIGGGREQGEGTIGVRGQGEETIGGREQEGERETTVVVNMVAIYFHFAFIQWESVCAPVP